MELLSSYRLDLFMKDDKEYLVHFLRPFDQATTFHSLVSLEISSSTEIYYLPQ